MPNDRKSSIRINNINKKRILALVGAAIVFISSMSLSGKIKKDNTITFPEGKVITNISLEVESGDELETMLSEYYTHDYDNIFSSYEKYEDSVVKQNDISDPDNIKPGDIINITVVVDEDNPYLAQISVIKNKISEINKNNFWVQYTVKSGDRIENLAERASGSFEEIYEYTNLIYSKNSIGSMLREGEEIWIINPELGELKAELKEAEENLKQSLTKTQIKK